MPVKSYNVKPFIDYVKSSNIGTPVKLEIRIDRILDRKNGKGRPTRFMRMYVKGNDVTKLAAKGAGLTISKARGVQGCAIVYGDGMDMIEYVQKELHHGAELAGNEETVAPSGAIYLGRKPSGHPSDSAMLLPV